MKLKYLTFDLLISAAAGDGAAAYQAKVIDSPHGQAAQFFTLPATITASTEKLSLVGGAIRTFQFGPATGSGPVQPLDPKIFGSELYRTIFRGEVGNLLRLSMAVAAQQDAGLRIRLRLDDAPVLAVLPWEYLFDATANRYLVLSDASPVVRYLALPQPEAPLGIEGSLRILVLTADAQDVLPRLNITQEQARLQQALAGLRQEQGVEITWLANGTLSELRQTLRRGSYHIFHFIGHGWFDEATRTNGLLFVDEQGKGEPVSSEILGLHLHNHRTLRLAFLNACEGARLVEGEPFNGVAQQLVQQGLPAVIAMQFPVTDQAAIELSREFYTALADDYPVDAALAEARIAIFSQGSIMEWGTPVLFMRTADGRLWTHEEQAEATLKQPSISLDGVQARDIVIGTVGTGAQNVAVGRGNSVRSSTASASPQAPSASPPPTAAAHSGQPRFTRLLARAGNKVATWWQRLIFRS
ncbi:MAG: CHAT domain-containing protein [Caldilineaceae bacterium]